MNADQSLAQVSSVSMDGRDSLPPKFQYGRVETISIAPLQKWKTPDSGTSDVGPSSQMIFYFDTGGAAFLDPYDAYLTFQFQVTNATALVITDEADACSLDCNTDAIFQETQLQINGNLVEHLLNLNLYSNIVNLLEKGCPYNSTNVPVIYGVVNGAAATVNAQNAIVNSDPECLYFGQAQDAIRQGTKLLVGGIGVVAAAGASTGTQNLAYHLKSFIIGQWAQQFFPLAFVNQIMYTMITDTSLKVLHDNSTTLATGAYLGTRTWTYALQKVRLHYTVVMVQDEVAAAVQRAYLSNALPDLITSIRTYQWQQGTQLGTSSGPFSLNYTLSGTSYNHFLFAMLRDGDFSLQTAHSLNNFVGGFKYIQVKVNGQPIPQNLIDMSYAPYELYRQLGYSYGSKQFGTQNIQVDTSLSYTATTAGSVDGSTCITNANQFINGGGCVTRALVPATIAGYKTVTGWGTSNPDSWNAPVVVPTSVEQQSQLGCTAIMFSVSDAMAMSGQNVKGGVAVRGMNLTLEITMLKNNAKAINPHLFAIQDSLLILKGTSVATLT